jgi:phospholipid transport system transporter-binding protein
MDEAMSEECTLQIDPDGEAKIAGPLTFETCPRLFAAMKQRLHDGAILRRIDLAEVSNVDSAGLALLLEWQAHHSAAGNCLVIHGAPSSLQRLASLCNAMPLLGLAGRDEA